MNKKLKDLEKHCEDQDCAEIIKNGFEEANNILKTQSKDIQDIKMVVNEVIQIQKNTTQNLNVLTNDVKDLIQNSFLHEVQHQELENLKLKVEELEENRIWLTRIIVGTFITLLVNLAFGGKLF